MKNEVNNKPRTDEQNNRNSRPRIQQVRYVKIYDNFINGLDAMLDICPVISELFREVNEYPPVSIDNAMDIMLNIFTNHIPSFDTKNNMHYDISLSANRCSLKTDKFVSFGWYVKTIKSMDSLPDTKFIFHINVFGHNEELVRNLIDNKWKLEQYNK